MLRRRGPAANDGARSPGSSWFKESTIIAVDDSPSLLVGASLTPAPIHSALDRLTVLTIQVQQLRRRLGLEIECEPGTVDASLAAIELELHELSGVLAKIRDRT